MRTSKRQAGMLGKHLQSAGQGLAQAGHYSESPTQIPVTLPGRWKAPSESPWGYLGIGIPEMPSLSGPQFLVCVTRAQDDTWPFTSFVTP